MELINPSRFANWLSPHSVEWYKQLNLLEGKYVYPWNSILTEPNGESVFDQQVAEMISNKKVLDVGCGHGEFTLKCSDIAREIVGFDVTDYTAQNNLSNKKTNLTFINGNSKAELPFKTNEFDCSYIRKGPTSAYQELKRVVKKGGPIIGLHPGDESGKELPLLFPNLFEETNGTPILDTIKARLASSEFTSTNLEVMNSIEFIQSPIDVLKFRCFGQQRSIFETIKEKNLTEISKIFEQNASVNGLPITFSRYMIRVIV